MSKWLSLSNTIQAINWVGPCAQSSCRREELMSWDLQEQISYISSGSRRDDSDVSIIRAGFTPCPDIDLR